MGDGVDRRVEAVALAIYEARVHSTVINGWRSEPDALKDRFRRAASAALAAADAVDDRAFTHVCLGCGALGVAGGYHDHGNGNAGETIALAAIPELVRSWQRIEAERDDLLETGGGSSGAVSQGEEDRERERNEEMWREFPDAPAPEIGSQPPEPEGRTLPAVGGYTDSIDWPPVSDDRSGQP